MGFSLSEFHNFVKTKLQYVPRWKDDPKRVLQIMTIGCGEWEMVKMELGSRGKDGGPSKSG